jgi:hypothetical protein
MKIIDSYGVDAGNISVVDLKYIESKGGMFGKTASSSNKKIILEPGKYHVSISLKDFYEDYLEDEDNDSNKEPVVKHGIIETSGEVVIGDVCYLFSSDESSHDSWSAFLDESETNYLQKDNNHCLFFDTGGDGSFEVEVGFSKI